MIDRQRLHDDAYRWEVVAGLIQDYGAAIMQYCLTWVGEGLSEEITQEVFVTAWEMLPKYRPEALLKAWLYGIARKKCMQAYRNRARRWVIAQTFVEEIRKRAHGEGQPSLGDCESQTTLCDRLSNSLTRLSDVDRMLLNLRYWKELPVVEIAEIMGKSEGAVRRQFSRAQQRLKELMHETPETSNHPQDDPPKDPEIDRWFRALGPPPVGHASPNLHAKVRAGIAQQQARWAVFGWRPRVVNPAWAVVLAVGLILSLGLNVWWSVRTLGLLSPRANQSADSLLRDLGAAGSLPTYRFQVSMQRAKALGTFVAAHSVRHPPVVVGFTPQAGRTMFFYMGTLYAEALATLHSGAVEATAPRLDILVQTLASVQAPRALSDYLREMLALVQRRPHEVEVLAAFLALFEPLYGNIYARNNEALMLFRTGAWLENMYLASAAGDYTALQQGGQSVEAFRSVLIQLHAPRTATEALERLRLLTARQTLTDQDVGTITTLVQDIQRVLSD